MRRGLAVVWSGWPDDVPPGKDRPTARFPIIPEITGMVREEFIAENTGLLGDNNIEELSEKRFVGTLVHPGAAVVPTPARGWTPWPRQTS